MISSKYRGIRDLARISLSYYGPVPLGCPASPPYPPPSASPILQKQCRCICTSKALRNSDEASKWIPPKVSNWDYLKGYVLAMLNDFDPLYKLHVEQKCGGHKVPGGWTEADSKTCNEVLNRLYTFEKRLLVAALALLYVFFLSFFASMIAYLRKKGREELGRNFQDLKVWECEFGTETAIPFDTFIEKFFLAGKVRKMSYYAQPSVLIAILDDENAIVVDCKRDK